MTTAKYPLIIYLKRNTIHVIGSTLPNPVTWDIPTTQIADLEVLKLMDFENFIKAHILELKIEPVQTALILSEETYFEKEIPFPTQPIHEDTAKMTRDFFENAPFEHLSTATFTLEKSSKIIATNQELLAAIQSAFESAGFLIIAIVPAFLVAQFNVDLKQGLDQKQAGVLFQHFEALKAYSLFPHQDILISPEENSSPTVKKPGGNRIIILVGIFVILIGVLVALIFIQSQQNAATLRPSKNTIKHTP